MNAVLQITKGIPCWRCSNATHAQVFESRRTLSLGGLLLGSRYLLILFDSLQQRHLFLHSIHFAVDTECLFQLRSSFPQPAKKAASALELGLLGFALFLDFFGLGF